MNIYLITEDSPEGIFSGVYQAYLLRRKMDEIHLITKNPEQQMLFAEYMEVETKMDYAESVMRTIKQKMGNRMFQILWEASVACDSRKADCIYRTIVLGLSGGGGHRTADYLTQDYVRIVQELSLSVVREYEHLQGFLRFAELENGYLYALISTKHDILALLAQHFANRFRNEDFIIFDDKRAQCAIHRARDGEDWVIMKESDEVKKLAEDIPLSTKESIYQECFRQFVSSIAIAERTNPILQRNMLPLRFRPYMTEFDTKNSTSD